MIDTLRFIYSIKICNSQNEQLLQFKQKQKKKKEIQFEDMP